jgi:DNA-directed RNA polymerase subunit RPC12/RpoP
MSDRPREPLFKDGPEMGIEYGCPECETMFAWSVSQSLIDLRCPECGNADLVTSGKVVEIKKSPPIDYGAMERRAIMNTWVETSSGTSTGRHQEPTIIIRSFRPGGIDDY